MVVRVGLDGGIDDLWVLLALIIGLDCIGSVLIDADGDEHLATINVCNTVLSYDYYMMRRLWL